MIRTVEIRTKRGSSDDRYLREACLKSTQGAFASVFIRSLTNEPTTDIHVSGKIILLRENESTSTFVLTREDA